MSAPRIAPIDPPYSNEIQEAFDRIMPPGMPPLKIFRTFARHPQLLKRTMALGGLLLNDGLVKSRDREIVLHRTCARCRSEYEWGVHVNAFARPLGFTEEQIRATVTGDAGDPAWSDRERLLIRFADELHDTATVSYGLWNALNAEWSPEQLLELMCVAGLYHAIAFVTNACGIELEENGERFPDDAAGLAAASG